MQLKLTSNTDDAKHLELIAGKSRYIRMLYCLFVGSVKYIKLSDNVSFGWFVIPSIESLDYYSIVLQMFSYKL